MTISQLIAHLTVIKFTAGDLGVLCQTLAHSFPPEPVVKDGNDGKKYLVLNP